MLRSPCTEPPQKKEHFILELSNSGILQTFHSSHFEIVPMLHKVTIDFILFREHLISYLTLNFTFHLYVCKF